jgi:polysaccharide pyruvyl transferase WcaK-like protein
MTKKILIAGYYGFGNYGDELFANVFRTFLGEFFQLTFLPDALTDPYFPGEGLASIVERHDLVIVGAGDLLNPQYIPPFYLAEEFLRRKVIIEGVGVPLELGSSETATAHLGNFLSSKCVKGISVRDRLSHDFLVENLGIDSLIKPDITLSLQILNQRPKLRTVTISPRAHQDDEHYAAMIEVAAEIRQSATPEVLISSIGDTAKDDMEFSSAYFQSFEQFDFKSIERITDFIASSEIVISDKFHVCLIGLIGGCTVIPISNSNKFKILLDLSEIVGRTKNGIYILQPNKKKISNQQRQSRDHLSNLKTQISEILEGK